MAVMIHRDDMVRKFDNDELSLSQKWTIDSSDAKESIKFTKLFLSLNGATGCNVKNIPPSLAGFFAYFVHVRIYPQLQLLRSRVQIYQRHRINNSQFARIVDEFNNIKQFWDTSVEYLGIAVDELEYSEYIRRFQEMETTTIRNFATKYHPSWVSYYNYVRHGFDQLVDKCDIKGNAYKQNYLQWFGSFFNPASWYNYVRHGLQSHATTSKNYVEYSDINVSKSNILFNRIEDINTASLTMEELREWIDLERQARMVNSNRTETNANIQAAQMFKAEFDRLISIVRDRVGIISDSGSIESN